MHAFASNPRPAPAPGSSSHALPTSHSAASSISTASSVSSSSSASTITPGTALRRPSASDALSVSNEKKRGQYYDPAPGGGGSYRGSIGGQEGVGAVQSAFAKGLPRRPSRELLPSTSSRQPLANGGGAALYSPTPGPPLKIAHPFGLAATSASSEGVAAGAAAASLEMGTGGRSWSTDQERRRRPSEGMRRGPADVSLTATAAVVLPSSAEAGFVAGGKGVVKKRSRGQLLGESMQVSASAPGVTANGVAAAGKPRNDSSDSGLSLSRSQSSSARYRPPATAMPTAPLPPPPPSAALTSPSPSRLSSHRPDGASTTTSSRSLLTIALQRAQDAVRLDTVEDVPSAISAYSEAVSLLEQVMAQMEAGDRERREREQEQEQRERAWERMHQARAAEMGRDVERDVGEMVREREAKRRERREKSARKAQLRAEEGVRLAKIHDTYASRIKELEADLASASASTTDDEGGHRPPDLADSSSADHAVEPPPSSPDANRPFLSFMDSPTLSAQNSPPPAAVEAAPSAADPEKGEGRAKRSRPTSAAFPTLTPMDPRAFGEDLSAVNATAAGSSAGLVAPFDKRSSMASDRTARPGSIATSTGATRASRSLAPVDERRPSISDYETPPEEAGGGSRKRRVDLGLDAEIAAQDRGRRLSRPAGDDEDGDEEKDVVESLPPSSAAPESSRDRSSSSVSGASSIWDRVRSRESLATSTRTSTSSLGGKAAATVAPLAEDGTAAERKGSLSPRASPSLINAPLPSLPQEAIAMVVAADEGAQQQQRLLVNNHTHQGTISQRRRSPLAGTLENDAPMIQEGVPAAAPLPKRSGGASALLPQRLRALSQPGRRSSVATAVNAAPPPPPPLPKDYQQRTSGGLPLSRKASESSTSSIPAFSSHLEPFAEGQVPRSTSPAFISGGEGEIPTPKSAPPSNHAVLGPFGAILVAPPQNRLPPCPANPARRPFHLMRQVRKTIQHGGYLTPRLYVPAAAWTQTNVALKNVETKVKLIECLISGVEGIDKDGDALLPKNSGVGSGRPQSPPPTPAGLAAGEKFLRRLDAFEELLDQLQGTLVKKLNVQGGAEFGSAGKKSGGLGGFGQKLSRSLDRITSGKNLDAPATYVDGIARLFGHAQVIDRHLACVLPPTTAPSPYAGLGPQAKKQIEQRLLRVSDFYGRIVCRFVVADMGLLLDKYAKRGGQWCID